MFAFYIKANTRITIQPKQGAEAMARPIEATPVLTGRSAARFDRLMKNVKYRPTPKRLINWKEIDRILREEAEEASIVETKEEPKP